jgi:hypothetical protein
MHKSGSVGLACIVLALTLAGCHGGQTTGQSSTEASAPPSPPRTIAAAATTEETSATISAESGATGGMAKLSPALAAMARQVRAATDASAAQALSNQRVHVNAKGQIQVYVYVRQVDADTEARLSQAGADIERGVATMKVYQAWATPEALERISKLPDVVRITPPAYGFPK